MEVIHLPLMSASRQEIVSTLKRHPAPMLWNVTDGLTVFCGSLVPSLGRILKIPTLGSDTYVQGICQNKHHWRAVLDAHGIRCLPGAVVRVGEWDEYRRVSELDLPLFVKAATYGNNTGFSVVDPIASSHDDACAKARQLLDGGLGPVLVEKYAEGREYSVWCFETQGWDAVVYEKVMDMPYLTIAAKDKKSYAGNYRLVPCEAEPIATLALKIVATLGIRDYVRFDIRECEHGIAYPIDINTGAFLVGRSFDLACCTLRGSPQRMFSAIVEQSWRRQMAQWQGN
jgi:D-alanine-D-alanine ligase and related ATP-grasp enzymes